MNPIIIIPTYNEVINAPKMIKYLFEDVFKNQNINILIIDSNSPDNTALEVEKLQQIYKNLHLIKQETKKGLASAYIEGFKWGLANNYDTLIQIDSDFQHPAEIMPDMLKKMEDGNYDLIIGSRYIKDGSWNNNKDEKSSIIKKSVSALGNIYVHLILDCKIKDLTGGYNIWSKKALETIDLDKIQSKGYLFQIEMKYYADKNKNKILEYPIIFNKRLSGKSKMDFKVITEAFTLIWKIRFKRNFKKN